MKLNANRPQNDKKNGTESSTSKIQEHLQDKNHVISDEDIPNIPVEAGSVENKIEEDDEIESESNGLNTKITEEDPDEENKVGLESPWNIFS